jgi:formylglycine-generating enzyme required for sulfatase activity
MKALAGVAIRRVVLLTRPIAVVKAMFVRSSVHFGELPMSRQAILSMVTVAAVVCGSVAAEAGVVIETVLVGHPGNAGELSGAGAGGSGPDRICGAVGYPYEIGMFEVTAGQYTEFLNAVAASDPYRLYNTRMESADIWQGCGILRGGPPGSYVYSVAADSADRPVNYVSWGDAARFANWLHNGQPTGAQDLSTTEDGAYYLNGARGDAMLLAVVREADATWVIPTEDEWYKAAYHKNDGVTGNYFDYPTSSRDLPSNVLDQVDPGNNANFFQSGYTIGEPYYRTPVGAFENSASPYGTFDQGGNVWEWNESMPTALSRGLRGGSFLRLSCTLRGAHRGYGIPTVEDVDMGFRVALVPEPATLSLLLAGGLVLTRRRTPRGSQRSGWRCAPAGTVVGCGRPRCWHNTMTGRPLKALATRR